MLSEEMDFPVVTNQKYAPFLLAVDPLDGSSNIDVNVSVGSIFSILNTVKGSVERTVTEQDFMQTGCQQMAAGYAIYGPVTMLVMTIGRGTHGFTLDSKSQQFLLTHKNLQVPATTQEFAINMSNSRFWEAPVSRYINECLQGLAGPRKKNFNTRWIASLVAEAHRILMRGGVFLYPRDTKDMSKPGRLRLLYEANPIGFLMEQAGARSSTGRVNSMTVAPSSTHQRIGFVFGAQEDVTLIESYHQE
jgi:fructose-1,6-bisphosphatase I/sedoheptulose-1,7-bisphosphatase